MERRLGWQPLGTWFSVARSSLARCVLVLRQPKADGRTSAATSKQPALACLAALLAGSIGAASWAAEEPPRPGALSAGEFDDPVEPLIPSAVPDEVACDRLEATALFASARTHEQRQELALALRQYERALRCDPGALTVRRQIIMLAMNLDRHNEAARYAENIAPQNYDDTVLLRRLGIELAESGDWHRAIALYEKVAAFQKGEKPSAAAVLWWMELGRLYYLTHQYQAAADQFARVRDALDRPEDFALTESARQAILGSSGLTHQIFGECFLEAGRTEEARRAFEQANTIKADAPLLAYNLARVLAREHKPQPAIDCLETYFAAQRESEGTGPYQLLSDCLKDLGHTEQLLPRFAKLHEADKENISLTYFLAEQYRQAGNLAAAEPLLRELCGPDTERPPLDAFQSLTALLHGAGRYEALLAVLGDVARRTGGFDVLGSAGKELLSDKPAVAALLAVAERSPEGQALPPARAAGRLLAGALLALAERQFDVANRYFERASVLEPDKSAEYALTWGLELLSDEQYDDAIRVFERIIEQGALPTENPTFRFYLAGALEMAGRTDEALAQARQAVDLQKFSPRIHSRVGWVLNHAKRYPEARQAYLELIVRFDRVQDSAETRDVLHDARLALSNLEVQAGRLPQAEEWLEQILDEFPQDAGALNDLGYLWADRNEHLKRSLRMAQAAVDVEPDNLAFRDSLGWVYYRLQRYPEAITQLRRAAEVDEPDGVVLDHLGDALSAGGDPAGAAAVWDAALVRFEKDQDVAKRNQIRQKLGRARGKAE